MMLHDDVADIATTAEELVKRVNLVIEQCNTDVDLREMHGSEYTDKYAIRLCKVRDSLNAIIKAAAEYIEFIAPA